VEQSPPLASVALLLASALATEILLSRAFAVVHKALATRCVLDNAVPSAASNQSPACNAAATAGSWIRRATRLHRPCVVRQAEFACGLRIDLQRLQADADVGAASRDRGPRMRPPRADRRGGGQRHIAQHRPSG
jgi:hypothetical protein